MSNKVIDRNILHNGTTYQRGQEISPESADYNALKKYLVNPEDLPYAQGNRTVRIVENRQRVIQEQNQRNQEVEEPKRKEKPAGTPAVVVPDLADAEEETETVDIPDEPDGSQLVDTPPAEIEEKKVEELTESKLLQKTNPDLHVLLEKKGFKKGEDFNENTVKKDLVRLYLEG